MYNNTNIEQLDSFAVKLRHKDKVVPGNVPTLLGVPDTEVLGILRIICEVLDGQQAVRKFGSQMM